MPRSKPKKRKKDLDMELFRYQENLRSIVKDLENIDRIIPTESSRYGCLFNSETHRKEIATIERRKRDLLSYIQTICRDHIHWSKRLLEGDK